MGFERNVFDFNSSINVLPYDWTDIKDILRKANIRTLGEFIMLGEDGLRKKKVKLGIIKMKKVSDYLKAEGMDLSSFYISEAEKLNLDDSIYALPDNSNFWIRMKHILYDNGVTTVADFLARGEEVLKKKAGAIDETLSKMYAKIHERLEKKEVH